MQIKKKKGIRNLHKKTIIIIINSTFEEQTNIIIKYMNICLRKIESVKYLIFLQCESCGFDVRYSNSIILAGRVC